VAFRLPDGRRIAWREAGSGRPLVLVHGWSGSSTVFAEAIEKLSSDFRVLAPDLRGHGDSDAGEGYALGELAADLRLWMEYLDLRDASLLGWSLGGQTVMAAFPSLRPRVGRLVLVGTTPRFTAGDGWDHGLPEGQVKAMARDLRRNYLKTMGDFFALQFSEGEVSRDRYRTIVEFAVRGGRLPEPEIALAALETLRGADQRPDLPEIDVPVLVVHGDNDRIVPPGAGSYLAAHLPEAKLATMAGVGHAPFLSRPQEVFQLWRDFLS
jgi:pimeloyl-[acyl-carrier protein] methyl ester esterase